MPTEQVMEPAGQRGRAERQSAEAHRATRRPSPRSRAPTAAARAARSRSSRCATSGSATTATPAVRNITPRHRAQPDHGADRAFGLRQEHADPLLQPHERPDPERARSTARSSTTARTSTARGVDPVEVRKLIGMVFQKPNPFPKSIYDNVAFGPRVIGMKGRHGRRSSSGRCGAPRCGTRSRTA